MRLSLRYRLLVPLTLLLLGDVGATAWAATIAARSTERRLAEQQWAVARTLTEPPFFQLTEPILKKMQDLSGAEFLFVHVTFPSQSTFPGPSPDPPADVPTATLPALGEEHVLGPPVVVGGREFRCLRLPLKPPHPNAGGDLYIFYPESLRRSAIQDAVRPLIYLGGGGGLLAFLLTVALGTRLVQRIRDLDIRTRLIAAGNFHPMPLPRPNDELRDLCQSVNDMAQRLAQFQQELRQTEQLRVLGQFSGGLAHQLRNAATGARLAVELYLSDNPSVDPEPLRVALRQLVRMESNLRQFLDFGKPTTTVKTACNLMRIVEQTISQIQPQAHHTGVQIVYKPSIRDLLVQGNSVQLGDLFGNVLSNAIEAAGSGGEVAVEVHQSDGQAVIEMSDTGPGPPSEIAGRLFDPFVTGKEQGVGLGLSVAQQVAQAHGGTITWQRRDAKTIFRIELPVMV
jgi:signal transduction histidine kinase